MSEDDGFGPNPPVDGCADCTSLFQGSDYTRIDNDSATLDGTYDKAQLLHIASHLSEDDPQFAEVPIPLGSISPEVAAEMIRAQEALIAALGDSE